jgi:bifunctional N-acetylglucosamine-1-phosphate-uridyltransferase/glucosamine-1-phosphate-acetyltransferase GlmU-like protein
MGMPVGGAEAGLRASLDAGEQEAAAEEDARLYRAVEGINTACDQVQERIVLKTRTLLARKGIALEDPQDVSRAINIAMTEAWEIDIDNRLSHFRNLHRYLGTRNCRLWPEIVKELRDLGNLHVPDAEE